MSHRIPTKVKYAIAFILVVLLSFKAWSYYFAVSSMPSGLGIWLMTYSKEENWGFGPGGNETGVRAFYLPASSADKVSAGGLAFLSSAVQSNNNSLRWHETPAPEMRDHDAKSHAPSLALFLDRYGFSIDIRKSIEEEIDAALREKGNYFSNTRGGAMILLVPKSRRAFFMYAG